MRFALWRRWLCPGEAVRTGELDRRIGKGNTAERDMQKIQVNEKASEAQKSRAGHIIESVKSQMEIVSSMKQVFLTIRSNEPLDQEIATGQELMSNFTKCSTQLFREVPVLLEVVRAIAKKLVDASRLRFKRRLFAILYVC